MRNPSDQGAIGRRLVLAGGVGAMAALLSGCVVAPGARERVVQRDVVVRQPPPPPRMEPPPRRDRAADWDPGRWQWNGREYVWVEGRYVERRGRRQNEVWRPGHWQQRGDGWVWVEGRWS